VVKRRSDAEEAERTHVREFGSRAARRLAAAVVADSPAALGCTARHDDEIAVFFFLTKKRKKNQPKGEGEVGCRGRMQEVEGGEVGGVEIVLERFAGMHRPSSEEINGTMATIGRVNRTIGALVVGEGIPKWGRHRRLVPLETFLPLARRSAAPRSC